MVLWSCSPDNKKAADSKKSRKSKASKVSPLGRSSRNTGLRIGRGERDTTVQYLQETRKRKNGVVEPDVVM